MVNVDELTYLTELNLLADDLDVLQAKWNKLKQNRKVSPRITSYLYLKIVRKIYRDIDRQKQKIVQ
jgi:hypothetical protein